jgi:hypothetical protein
LMYAGVLWTLSERFTAKKKPPAKAGPPRPQPEPEQPSEAPAVEPLVV